MCSSKAVGCCVNCSSLSLQLGHELGNYFASLFASRFFCFSTSTTARILVRAGAERLGELYESGQKFAENSSCAFPTQVAI